MKLLIVILLIAISASSYFAQRAKSALLPSSEAKALTNQCSRPSPSDFSETWEPTSADILKMESNLSSISRLKAKSCCIEGVVIKNPDEWYLQYVGIVQNGKKLIYISAISKEPPQMRVVEEVNGVTRDIEGPDVYWRRHALTVCDGGTAWGVLYEPATGKFSDLAVNGIG